MIMTARKPYPTCSEPDVPIRPIPGFEGSYSASEDGRIWSEVRRVQKTPRCQMLIGGKWLKPCMHHGYWHVALRRGPNTKTYPVHRLVAMAWIPIRDKDLWHVNHKNGVRTDNRVANLEWCTPRENNLHAYRTLGKRGPGALLTDEQVIQIRCRIAAGEKQRALAREFGISESIVSMIKHHYTYRRAGNEIEFSLEPPSAPDMAEAA